MCMQIVAMIQAELSRDGHDAPIMEVCTIFPAVAETVKQNTR